MGDAKLEAKGKAKREVTWEAKWEGRMVFLVGEPGSMLVQTYMNADTCK